MTDYTNKESLTGRLWGIILHAQRDGMINIENDLSVISSLNNISGLTYLESNDE